VIPELVARQGRDVRVFDSEEELRKYTISEGKFFPLEEAYAGGLLEYLLREIVGTYYGNRDRRGSFSRKGMNANSKAKGGGNPKRMDRE